MRKFFDEWKLDLRSEIHVFIWAVLTVVVAVSGPFGTYRTVDLPLRLVLAGLLIGMAIVMAAAIRALVVGVFGIRGFWRCALLTAGVLGLLVPSITRLVLELPAYKMSAQIPDWLELSFFTVLCSLSVSAYRHGKHRRWFGEAFIPDITIDPSETIAPVIAPRLFDRLPDDRKGALLSISVRDHYVDVRTTNGETSILMRLSDAIAETEGVDGAQVHRSHWVAWAAVVDAERTATRILLTLSDGTKIPSSKTYRDLVEARLEGLGIGSGRTEPDAQASANADGSKSASKSG